VTEIPYAHGESFPGLLHLSWTTFESGDSYGYSEVFRAHEVAHQWWGVTVGYKSYHDQWLSEGFAQYCGLWYMQQDLKEDKKLLDILDRWKLEMFTNRKYIFGSGAEAGPIWLGYRTSSTETRGDYGLIVYRKGAYVLHMLRCMLLNPATMSDSLFSTVLRDFWTEYKGRDATTEDFRHAIEAHTGTDMGWFFRQWIYDNALPTYRFSYSVAEEPGGKYRVVCHVAQQNVPQDFRMPVLLLVKYADGSSQRLRVVIDKPIVDIPLPHLPAKPDEIIFNDFNSVLAEVEYD
jgi:aminopeptidase N